MAENCVEIIKPFVDTLEPDGNVLLIGGVGSYVLKTPGVEIRPEYRAIIAPADIDLAGIGQYRDDGNLRDVDILVRTANQAAITRVEEAAQETIGDALDISVFGLRKASQLTEQRAHPIKSLRNVWLADRYVSEVDGDILGATKALFPFAVKLPKETMETWQLYIGNNRPIPVAHPGTVILNYLTRSISGLRPKDAGKVNELGDNIFKAAPEILDWIVDGDGKSQLVLARLLHTMRESSNHPRPLVIGERLRVTAVDDEQLQEHPALQLLSDAMRKVVLSATRSKARGLHLLESSPQIVTLYQRHGGEKRLKTVVHNEASTT